LKKKSEVLNYSARERVQKGRLRGGGRTAERFGGR
jgi:hypothetical protein